MKRSLLLLLAALAFPTAVNANPFSGDLILKTDLGEKYIVKKNALTIREVNSIYIFKYSLSGKVYRSLEKKLKNFEPKTQRDISDIQYYAKQAKDLESNYEKYKPILDKYADGVIVTYEISYKPIFQNINNYKIVMNEKSIICINPLFKNESFVKKYHRESLQLDLLDEKVCSKFANFKLSSYDDRFDDK